MQVHTKRRNMLLHDRMRDLVFVKFNSKLRQKKDNKDKDPLEKPVLDVLEDEDNEWITGIEPTEEDLEQEGQTGASSQGVAVAPQREETRRGGNRTKKRKRLIPTSFEDEELSVPSSDGEDDNEMPSYLSSKLGSDSEAQSD
jgi:hypothetical protein